jgi:hypothetical protein
MTARELVDLLCPKHDRTSCSDDNINNGFDAGSHGLPRCSRCALLEIVESKYIPKDMVVNVCFHKEN